MNSGESCMNAGFRRQVRRGRANRLHAGLLVVRDDYLPLPWLRRRGAGCLKDFHLFVNTEDLRHFNFKLGVAALKIVTHLVWLDRLGAEDLANRALSQTGKAIMAASRPTFARMAGQKARRPQLMWIAEILGFPAGQRHEPCLGLGRDRRLFAWPGAIIQRRQWTERHGPLDTAPDRLP